MPDLYSRCSINIHVANNYMNSYYRDDAIILFSSGNGKSESSNQFLFWGLTLDNICVWERQQPLILKGKFPLCLFLLQLSLNKLLVLASSWNEFLLLWTSLGSLLLQLGFCSSSLVLLPDLTELALFIVKSLWWCHWPSWFQSSFKRSTVEAGLWLCKLSFAGPD